MYLQPAELSVERQVSGIAFFLECEYTHESGQGRPGMTESLRVPAEAVAEGIDEVRRYV